MHTSDLELVERTLRLFLRAARGERSNALLTSLLEAAHELATAGQDALLYQCDAWIERITTGND